jgi:hypothetical protein
MNDSNTKPFNKPTNRDERGLLKNVDYIFNQDGSVNWRAMVKPAHLYPNRGSFERFGKPVPDSIEGLEDNKLLIKLSGIKEVAKLRGYSRISYTFPKLEKDYVVAVCSVDWISNFESTNQIAGEDSWEACSSMDVANATSENTDGFGQKFLETIAANRAFVRAVRNYLGIHIVGEDEIDKKCSGKVIVASDHSSDITPQGVLKNKFRDSEHNSGGDEFESFKDFLRSLWKSETYRNEEASKWKTWTDIPVKEARALIKFV